MKKSLILLIASILLVANLGFSNAVSFKIGYFFPRAKSDLWQIEFENMNFTLSNYQNSTFGFSYEYFLTRQISIVFGVDGYNRNRVGFYKDYVGISFDDGDYAFPNKYRGDFDISHVYNVSITPFQISLKLVPTGRRGGLIPFVGGGLGLYLWTVRLQGDTILFDEFDYFEDEETGETVIGYVVYPIDAREENRFAFGYHVYGGLMFPVANRIAIEAEFKYNIVKGKFRGAPEGSFQGFEPFDLGGFQISIGINYWF